jgi:hypothetical protein
MFVIVEYNFAHGGYVTFAYHGKVFTNKAAAANYMTAHDLNEHCYSIEELEACS